MLSRAVFDGEMDQLIGKEFPYVIDYQLESLKKGTVIMAGAFNLRAKVKQMVDENGELAQSTFFRDGNEILGVGKSFHDRFDPR